jgi:hypothetical protein
VGRYLVVQEQVSFIVRVPRMEKALLWVVAESLDPVLLDTKECL